MGKRNRAKAITAKEVWLATQKEPQQFRLTKKEAASLARGLNQARNDKLTEINFKQKNTQ